jgi:4-hydroxy-4-methyl-2-oxoglutarate aldolase
LNIPVRVGGVWINPGDLLHGDRNGVTTIPHHLAEATARGCVELMAAEQIVLDYLKSTTVTGDGFANARKQCGAKIHDLSKTLKAMITK